MRKIRVLIAEDEPPVGRFIKRLLEELNCYVCGVYESTEQTLQALEYLDADILITDICMPGCNGLDLIEAVKKRRPDMQFMIISGHQNFSYAKQAIGLGVEAYLTKPIEKEELQTALTKIRRYLWNKTRSERSTLISQAFASKDVARLQELFAWKCFSALAVFSNTEPDLGQFWDSEMITVFRYKSVTFFLYGENMPGRGQAVLRELGAQICNQALGTAACLLVQQAEAGEKLHDELRLIYQRVQMQTVYGEQQMESISSTEVAHEFEEIQDTRLLHSVTAELYANHLQAAAKELKQLFALWEKESASIYYVRRKMCALMEKVERSLQYRPEYDLCEVCSDIVLHAISYQDCCKKLCVLLRNAEEAEQINAEKARKKRTKDNHQVFLRIQSLLEENIEENYSLQELSELFHLSQPYIRDLFKKYTGLSYKNYILNEKINIAKEMIQANPQIRVKDVAEHIGFEPLYFSTVFSKNVGVSPTAYKLQYQASECIQG